MLHKVSMNLHTDSEDFTIHRILGHKSRMKGAGQWKMETLQQEDSCWVCDRWMYCLYFWNQDIGCFNDVNRIGIDKPTKVHVVDQVRLHNPDTYMDNEDVPVLFSNITNWKPKPFMTILDFLDTLEDSNEPDYDSVTLSEAQRVWDFDELHHLPAEKQVIVKKWMVDHKIKMKEEFVKVRLSNTTRIITDHLRYKDPCLINFDKVGN